MHKRHFMHIEEDYSTWSISIFQILNSKKGTISQSPFTQFHLSKLNFMLKFLFSHRIVTPRFLILI